MRTFGPRSHPVQNRPSYQPDEVSIKNVTRGQNVPFDEIVSILDSRNVPPQLRQTPYAQLNVPNDTPVILIPANPNRMSFIVAATTGISGGLLWFSYGFPVRDINGALIGIPISNDTPGFFQEGNGTVSIDDIYVFVTENDEGSNVNFMGYEGVLAIESHMSNQTS